MTPILARGEKSTMAAFALRQRLRCARRGACRSRRGQACRPGSACGLAVRSAPWSGTGCGRIWGLSDGLPKTTSGLWWCRWAGRRRREAGSTAHIGQAIESSRAWAGSSEEAAEAVRECVDILNVWARKSSRRAMTGSQIIFRGYRPESVSEMRAYVIALAKTKPHRLRRITLPFHVYNPAIHVPTKPPNGDLS